MKKISRYAGEKQNVMKTSEDLAKIRKDILQKINLDDKERLEQEIEGELEDLDDNEFKQRLIKELEDELLANETTTEKKSNSFVKKILSQKKDAAKREAEELLEKLKGIDDLGDLDMDDPDADPIDDDDDEETIAAKKAAKEEALKK